MWLENWSKNNYFSLPLGDQTGFSTNYPQGHINCHIIVHRTGLSSFRSKGSIDQYLRPQKHWFTVSSHSPEQFGPSTSVQVIEKTGVLKLFHKPRVSRGMCCKKLIVLTRQELPSFSFPLSLSQHFACKTS